MARQGPPQCYENELPLLKAMGTAISALTAQNACGFFEHCDLCAEVQAFRLPLY
jgi:hypothetical protein